VVDGPNLGDLLTIRRAYDVSATVLGEPQQQGSKRPVRNQHSGKIRLLDMNADLEPWREKVAAAMKLEMQRAGLAKLDEPVYVRAVLTMPMPARPKYVNAPAVPPDLDKLARALLDAMKRGGVYRDDALVVGFDRLVKVFPGRDPEALGEPGARLYVRRAFPAPPEVRELDPLRLDAS
jgi:crossover junction endodeoxyribonuclease RusA